MTEEELKQWLKDNLMLEIEHEYPYQDDNNTKVSLRFVGDREPFTYEYL